MRSTLLNVLVGTFIVVVLLVAASFFLPWERINWGSIQISPGKTVTVTGESQSKQKNQVASYTAGVSVESDNKDTAVSQVNQATESIIKSVKDFGIKADDIQTQGASTYQRPDNKQWTVTNSIQITLRDVDRASNLLDLLNKSGATNVYGPTFSLESSKEAENKLLQEAIEDAKKKAEVLANASGRKLGKVLSVSEGFQTPGIFAIAKEGLGGGAPTEPGSTTTSKTVTVTFALE